MLKLAGKADRMIWLILYGVFVIWMGCMIILSITGPQHNLIPWQMAIGTGLGTVFLLAAFFLWDKFPLQKIKRSSLFYRILLISFGILLYTVSCLGRNSPASFVDYYQVWNAAKELSSGGVELSGAWYFRLCANNIKPMLYLSVIFRIARFFHISDPFYFALLISVLEVLGGVWGAGILAGESKEERAEVRIPVLLMFMCTLPIWANVQAFYTDGMSFAVAITVLALLRLCMENNIKWKTGIYVFLAGVIFGIGMTVKVTVWIPVIAGFVVLCFAGVSRTQWKTIGMCFVCCMAVYGTTNLAAQKFEIWNEAKDAAKPVEHYIALGLKGNGSYADNAEFSAYSDTLSTKKEKVEYALRYIRENRSEFWNPSHLIAKLRHNFASGSLGTKDYTYLALKEHNLIWEFFSPWGKYYWRSSQICFCYFFAIYTCYLLGGIFTLYNLLKKRAVPALKAVADLALMGNMIFLMIWEANNRQLYNQVPVILLGAVWNIQYVVGFLTKCKPCQFSPLMK